MVAGPPKVRIVVYWFVLVFLLVLPCAALGQDVQSSSLTVEDLITVIADVDTLTDAQKETLSASLLDVADSGSFSPDELLAVLSLAEIGSVSLAEADFVVAALETAFDVLLSGESDLSTVMDALSGALDTQDLGVIDGLLQSQVDSSRAANAIEKALTDSEYDEASVDSLLAQADDLIAQGLPPGIVVRVLKDALRSDLDADDLSSMLADVSSLINDDTPPGQAANQVTGQGEFRNTHQHQEQEENMNTEPNEEPEEEQNSNAPEEKEKGTGKDKEKDKKN
jgi:hypothetical protein